MTQLPPRSASLAPFFNPRGVALIGASRDPGKLSYGVLRNLTDPQSGYPGPIYPVNPKADEILGLRCYPDISSVPDPVELAIMLIPAGMVPEAVEACGKRGLKAAVIISGGFREVGPEGLARERQVVEIAARYGLRLMGPNGIGVIDTHTPLNTTFVRGMPARGGIAFLSQSGALCGGIIDWIIGRGIGFSRLLSVGNEADVNETDALPFLAADEDTRVITLYLEDVKGGPAFVPALRDAAAAKPVLAIKTGRTRAGQAATASHTGALAGTHAAFRAACKQAGAIEVESIETMFDGALALSYQPLPKGGRIALLTNAGGPAALAADAMETAGLSLARTGRETQAALRPILMPDAQVAGVVDMLGGASDQDYRKALEIVLADPSNDGVLVILVPQVLVKPVAVVNALAEVTRGHARGKPVLACLMGEASLKEAFQAAHRGRIPAYTFPEAAVAAFGVLYRRSCWTAAPHPAPVKPEGVDLDRVNDLLQAARAAGRTGLDAAEGRAVLQAAGIPVPADLLATTPDETVAYAKQIGFPVALKLASPDILHKTDIGGVILGVQDEAGARAGFQAILQRTRAAYPSARIRGVQVQQMIAGGQEIILGVKRDPTFGPLVMFGLGGVYVEALADVSFRLAPLTRQDAEEMIAEVRSAKLLSGLRGQPPADREALVDALIRVSWLAAGCPEIAELDVNPLMVLAEGQGALAADVRIILENRK
ncbi:MAG TPA: acetate--CoA ligase family protein [Anaerolineaceae bacterium]|nr:acetate--CoA ligase family protein [Anaerolineaceae bacterium]